MEILIENKKKEVIDWVKASINEFELDTILDKIHKMKPNYYSDNFNEEIAKGYTSQQARKKSIEKLQSWWGK